MDQKKIGEFISEQRKLKGLTQEKLAEKMGVSINAVSKWERGICLPDVSLYKNLCNELNISLEEFINGEKSSSIDAVDNAIIKTLDETKKIKSNNKKVIGILLIFFVIIFIILLYLLCNLNVNLVNNSDDLYDKAIAYLRKYELANNPDRNKDDFNVFFSYYGFGIESKMGYKYVYMWIYDSSMYVEDGTTLEISSGASMPYKFTFKEDEIVSYEIPKDGSEYISSIKEMFPLVISNQVIDFDTTKKNR